MPLRSRWTLVSLCVSMLVVAACSTDQFASPPPATPDSPAAGPAPSFLFLAFTAGQAACEAATPRRDFAGKFLGWQVAQQRPTIARTAADTGMVNLQLIRFAKGTRMQTDFVNCVLPNNDASRAFMRDYFKTATRPPGIGLGIVAASVMEFLTCYWDGNGWNCGHGMYCQSSWNGLRAVPATGPISAAPSSLGDEIGTFACTGAGSDGCWIDVQDYGSGTYYHTWGGTCDDTDPEEEPEEGGGGSGTGPNPEPDPEDLSLASCSRDEDTAVDGWGEPGLSPIDAPDVEICSGTGSESCLKGSPGIWVGSWRITEIWNAPVNARHTATARSTSTTVWITELLGPMPLSRWWELELHIDQPSPYYDGISGYRWVKVAGSSATAAYQIGVQNAREFYESDVYWASSNRFVSRILKASGIRPTAAMFNAIGFAPGIKSCFYW